MAGSERGVLSQTPPCMSQYVCSAAAHIEIRIHYGIVSSSYACMHLQSDHCVIRARGVLSIPRESTYVEQLVALEIGVNMQHR